MKIIATLFGALLLTACAASTEYYRSIDEAHYKAGQVDTLRIYDENGNLAGHIKESSSGSRVYDRDGNFVGFIK